jgi:hypothetical protein
VHSFNTIATLHFHMNYYVTAITKVLEGGPLDAKDKLASLIEHLPESRLTELFDDEKYGTVYRNLTGLIEHTHYHLGQIVLIKKILNEPGK